MFWSSYVLFKGCYPGGHSTFFHVGVFGLNFRSVGLANWHLPLKRGACERKISKFGGLWAENFQIWGACELKISIFWGLWTKIWAKIEAIEAKISKFSQKGVLWSDSFAWNGTLASGTEERREKGVFRAAHPHTPFLGQCPQDVIWFKSCFHLTCNLGFKRRPIHFHIISVKCSKVKIYHTDLIACSPKQTGLLRTLTTSRTTLESVWTVIFQRHRGGGVGAECLQQQKNWQKIW